MTKTRKALIFTSVLAVAVHPTWGYSGRGGGRFSSPSQSHNQPSTRLTTAEQRNLLRHSLSTAELAGKHMGELEKSAAHGQPNLEEIQQHLKEVRSAVDSMLELHRQFRYSLTEEQWAAAKDPMTKLELLRARIQAQLDGIDLELKMPAPSSKVFARYGKKMGDSLEDWRKQNRKIATATGLNLGRRRWLNQGGLARVALFAIAQGNRKAWAMTRLNPESCMERKGGRRTQNPNSES